jgi:hypothetical protein
MAKKSGWWEFETSVKPSEADLGHISELIKQGYTEGEIAGEDDIYFDLPLKRKKSKKVI